MTDLHSDFINSQNNGPLLTLGITTDPIHHKKSTDHSSPYGLLQIQFAIKNLRTTPYITDLRMFNLPYK